MSWENAASCNKRKIINTATFPAFRDNFPKQLQLIFGLFRSHLVLLQCTSTIGRSGKQAVYYTSTTTVNPKREGK